MAEMKYLNDAVTSLASTLSDVATSAEVSSSAAFPVLGAGDWFWATLRRASDGAKENVRVTAVAGTTWTIEREAVAYAFSAGDGVYQRVNAELIDDLRRPDMRALGRFAAAGGTADVMTATLDYPARSLVDGMDVSIRAVGANTVTTPTLNLDGLGAVTITRLGGTALIVGDIMGAGHEILLRYRASPARWELINPGSIENTMTAYVRTLIDDATAPTARVTLGAGDRSVANRTALKALTPSETQGSIYINGRDSAGDGGEGQIIWMTGDFSSEVTADSNEGVWFESDEVASTSGAWKRDYKKFVTPRMFGCVGDLSASDAIPLQKCFNWIRDNYALCECDPTDRYLVDVGVTFSFPGRLKMNGARIVADETSMSANTVTLTVTTTVAELTEDNATKECEVYVQGPYGGENMSAPPGTTPLTSLYQIDGIKIDTPANQTSNRDFTIWCEGFRDGIIMSGSNWWLNRFHKPNCGKHWRRAWSFNRTGAAGEMITLFGGVTYNCVNGDGDAIGFYEDGTTNLDASFYGHSIDYCDVHMDVASGKWQFYGCHSENHNDNPQFKLRKTVSFSHPVLLWHGARSPASGPFGAGHLPIETSGGRPAMIECYDGGVVEMHGVELFPYNIINTEMVKMASGVPLQINITGHTDTTGTGKQATPYSGTNLLYNSAFESGDFTGWTQNSSTGTTQSIESVAPLEGTYSARVVSTSGNSSSLVQTVACRSNELFIIQARASITSYTGGSCSLVVAAYNSNGDLIDYDSTKSGVLTSVIDEYMGNKYTMPPGTSSFVVQLYCSGFTGTVLWDEVKIHSLG